MTIQTSDAIAHAQLDSIETTIGTLPKLQLRSGLPPANCAAADTGVLLAEITCPSDWAAAAASRQKTLLGTWQVAASAPGYVGHFRLKNNAGSVTGIQGLCAQKWTASTPVVVGQHMANGGNTYRCTTAGSTASSGGPTGTGASIADGSAVWAYAGASDMIIDNTNVTAGQQVTVSTFTLTASNP